MEQEKKVIVTDDEVIEEVDSTDDAPIEIIYRCKKCGQILSADAKDCWKCSSKEIEQVVEEETKELKKVMLQARMDKIEHEFKQVKKNNDILFFLLAAAIVLIVILVFTNR